MNNEVFKKFIEPYYDFAVQDIGPQVIKLIGTVDHGVPFVAGHIVGQIGSELTEGLAADWRDSRQVLDRLTHEEVRRVFDYVRLRLETGSATS